MRLFFLIIWNIIIATFLRLRYGSRYKCSILERIAPSVDIRLYGHSSLCLGRNVEISKDSELLCFDNSNLTIGDGCYFNSRFMVSCHSGVAIGNRCLFGPDVKIFDNDHVFSIDEGVSCNMKCGNIQIGNNCWIASNVVILRDTIIGDNCVIGAGCVVKGIIPDGSIVKMKCDCIIVEKMKK